jgi:hypothetical protein
MLATGGSNAEGFDAVANALVVEGLEDPLRDTRPARTFRRRRGRWRAVGGLAARNDYHAEGNSMTLCQDPLNLPDGFARPEFEMP